MILYYYTGHKFLRKILQDRRVKLSRYGSLNDPFELAPYDISDPKIRSRHKDGNQEIAKMAGLICLSETRHSPAMWAHYTNNHKGVCLEIEVTFDHIFKIEYQTKKLFPGLTLEKFKKYINEDNFEIILGTKSKDWSL